MLASTLPPRIGYGYGKLEPYGFYILIILLYLGLISAVMLPIVIHLMTIINQLSGLSL